MWGTESDIPYEAAAGKYPAPFVYDGKVIRLNTEMGVHSSTMMMIDKMHINGGIKYQHGGANSKQHTHITGPALYVYRPHNNSNILYVNTTPGAVKIMLGESGDVFTPNQTLTIKDVALHYGKGSSHNITIEAAEGSALESSVRGRMSVTPRGTYNLSTSGGSVTLRCVSLTGCSTVWTVDQATTGNMRIPMGFRQMKQPMRKDIAGY